MNLNKIGQLGWRYVRQWSHRFLSFFFFFLVSEIFPGNTYNVILLGSECSNPQNLIKILEAIFEEIEILNMVFFLRELPFILRAGRKQKYGVVIFARGPYILNFNKTDQLI